MCIIDTWGTSRMIHCATNGSEHVNKMMLGNDNKSGAVTYINGILTLPDQLILENIMLILTV